MLYCEKQHDSEEIPLNNFFCRLVTPWRAGALFDTDEAFFRFLVSYDRRCNTIRVVMFAVAFVMLLMGYAGESTVFCGIAGMLIASAGMMVIGVISVPTALSAAILLIGGGLVGLAVFALLGVLAVMGLRKMVTAMVRWLRHKNETRKANRIEGRNQG